MKKFTPLQPLVLIFILSLFSCQPNSSSESPANGSRFSSEKVEKSFEEVMAIHDEVMPFISDMKKDKKKLIALKENQELKAEELTQINQAISQLVKGDSLMFAWMKEFKSPDSKTSEADALPYLAKEKAKVEIVNTEMKKAMKMAKSILEIY